MSRDVTLPVAAQPTVRDTLRQAELTERLGYGRVWVPETWGHDAPTVLATIAERTDDIGIGTSVVPVYSRSPALLGQTAATLQELSRGRFRLGVGPSGPAVVENWHGVGFDRPLRTTRETVEIVTSVLAGDTLEYGGDRYRLSGFRLRADPPEPPPAVDVSGMGPKAVELAGRFADGWHAIMLTRDGFRDRLDDLRRGAAHAGRDPDELRVMRTLTCCALDDGERARTLARRHVAFYLGGMGSFYRESLDRQGHGAVARSTAERWAAGDREAAAATLPDDLIDELSAAGTPERARERLGRWESVDGVDAVAVSFPRGATLDEIETTLESLAP